jgi:hypothetical protein
MGQVIEIASWRHTAEAYKAVVGYFERIGPLDAVMGRLSAWAGRAQRASSDSTTKVWVSCCGEVHWGWAELGQRSPSTAREKAVEVMVWAKQLLATERGNLPPEAEVAFFCLSTRDRSEVTTFTLRLGTS